MTKIVYRPGQGDPVATTWRGHTFTKDQPLETDNADLIEAARGNPYFDVDGESKAEARAKAQEHKTLAEAQAELAMLDQRAHELEERHATESAQLEAKHQTERDAFLSTNQQRADQLRALIRGSDGSDDQRPADGQHDPIADPAPLTPPPSGGNATPASPPKTPADAPAPQV